MSLHASVWFQCDGCGLKTFEYLTVGAARRGAKTELFERIAVNGEIHDYCMDCAPRIEGGLILSPAKG